MKDKSTYTDARARAVRKYLAEKVDTIQFRVPAGMKQEIKDFAALQGESMNAFLLRVVSEAMQQDA